MPSFDIVSEVNWHELTNALDQANREIATRFDFKGADAKIEQTQQQLRLEAETEFQLQQMTDVLYKKMAKRQLDINILQLGQPEIQNRRARLVATIQQGIDKELAKDITKIVKVTKLKVQTTIQGDQIRITGKKRDELQQIITLLREQDFELPLQFINFRD